MEVYMDFVGTLTRTKRGHSAILVVLDGFSKFLTFYPVRRISAQVVVDCHERNYFPIYGVPQTIITDNASVFRYKQVNQLCFKWAVKHATTTPYYPQVSLVERANRNLKSALKVFHHQSQNRWDEHLPLLSAAFNTAVHESSKCTPQLLFLGRELRCPLSSRWDLSSISEAEKTGTNSFWTRAYGNLKAAREKVARRYDALRKTHSYKEGDLVMYKRNLVSSKAQNTTTKLLLRGRSLSLLPELSIPITCC